VITVYGLSNCDSCRKARAWLAARGSDYDWHEIKTAPVPQPVLAQAVAELGVKRVVNRRSTTWRGLSAEAQVRADEPAHVPALLQEHPGLMKRPLISTPRGMITGFDADALARLL